MACGRAASTSTVSIRPTFGEPLGSSGLRPEQVVTGSEHRSRAKGMPSHRRVCWTALLAALLLSLTSAIHTQAELAFPLSAALSNETTALLVKADEKGLKLVSLSNLLTRAEYLHPSLEQVGPAPAARLWAPWSPKDGKDAAPPALPTQAQLSADSSSLGNPFTVFRQSPAPELFRASEDFTITDWQASNRRLDIAFQGRGLLVKGSLRITMAAEISYWELKLHNQGSRPLEATVSFPAFARAQVTSRAADTVLLPEGSGATLADLLTTRRQSPYTGHLSSPFALLQGDGQGLFVVDMERSDQESVQGQTYERIARVSADATPDSSQALPEPLQRPGGGPLLALENRIRLEPGGDITLGPVAVGVYQGTWMEGARRVHEIRGRVPRGHRTAAWFAGEPFLAQTTDLKPETLARAKGLGATAVVLMGYTEADRSDYLRTTTDVVGPGSLKRSIDAAHAAGVRVLLSIDGSLLSKESPFLKQEDAAASIMRDEGGKRLEPYKGFWRMCPANLKWRDWLCTQAARLLRTTGADGFFVDSICALPADPCYTRGHDHPTPYAWNWGARRLLMELRERIAQVNTETVLVAAGSSDIAREFVDGFVSLSHQWTGHQMEQPVLRAVFPTLNVFEAFEEAGNPELSERQLAWNFANGLALYVGSINREVPLLPQLQLLRRYHHALPEITGGAMVLAEVKATSPELVGRVFSGNQVAVTLANLGDAVYKGAIQLPEAIVSLTDPLSNLTLTPDASGRFEVALPPRSATAWSAALKGAQLSAPK
ncbi:MAG TPA: DUF6259 domain-containing protein [Armatimonadota bacterium]